MKKLFLLFLLSVLLLNFVSATDVAYVVKSSSNANIVAILNELNYSYNVISDSQISGTNFSNYAMLLIQDDLTNKDKLPLTTKNALFINRYIVPLVWPTVSLGSTSAISSRLEQLGTPFTEGFSSIDFQAYTTGKSVYYLKIKPSYVSRVAYSTGSQTFGSSIVAYSINSSSNLRRVFFGFSEINYWTSDTKKLFKNSLKWTRKGVDFDGDGYYSDNDCNDNNKSIWQNIPGYLDSDKDGYGAGSLLQVCSGASLLAGYSNVSGDCNNNNASINPDATEIAYDSFDNDCKNGDLADVDGDGWCKKNYWIQNRFVQCVNEAGSLGSDCDEQNALINPDAIEILNNIDENCMNDAPFLISNISNLSWNEDENISVDLSNYFADYEGNNLIFSVYNMYDGNLSVNFNDGVATLGSGKDFFGNRWVIFKASDSLLYGKSNNITLTVLPVNDKPILQNISSIRVVEGQEVRITGNASDVDNNILTYSINDSRFNQTGNIFVWQTVIGNAGNYNFLVSVSDGNLSDSKTVSIEIVPKLVINEFLSRPGSGDEWVEIYNPQDKLVDLTGCYIEDAAMNHVQLSGSIAGKSFFVKEMSNKLNNDGDSIKLICSQGLLDQVVYGNAQGNAPIPNIDESLGRIPDGNDTDQDYLDFKRFKNPTKGLSNLADVVLPIVSLISPINNSEIVVNNAIFNYTASDDKATSLNCSLYSDVKDGVFKLLVSQMTENGTKNNFYANNVENGNYKWQVKCKDERNTGESEIRRFRINVPKAPVMQTVQNITINETEIARITVNASDSNPEDILTYSVNDTRFLQNETNKNVFTWQTGYNDVGAYNVKIIVSDGVFNISQTVKITVLNKNRVPVLTGNIVDLNWSEDAAKEINLSDYFSDPDGDNLAYSVYQKSSDITASFNGSIARLSSGKDFFGNRWVIFKASDSSSYNLSNNATITILPVNDAPVLKPISDISVQETQQVRIIANASDVDNNILTYSINDTRFNQTGNIFMWQTGYNDDGVYYASVSVSDSNLSDSKIVKITVADKNEPPHIQTIENITILEDSGFIDGVILNASDNDGSIDRFEIVQEDTGKVDCSISDRIFGVQTGKDFYGQATCKIRVYDNGNAYDETITYIIVLPVNDAPTITSYSPGFDPIVSKNGKQEFSISWKDIDNPNSDIGVKWYVDNNLTGIGNSYNYNGDGSLESKLVKAIVSDLNSSVEQLWNLSVAGKPVATTYDGNTTNFAEMNESDLGNVNLVLEKEGKGKIEWIDSVDLRDVVDFDHYSALETGLAALDTGYFKTLIGKIAKITLYGLGFDKIPSIYYDSGFKLNKNEITQLCPDDKCKNVSYDNGTLSFFASFSSFKIGDTLSCSEQYGEVCSESEICQGNWMSAVEERCCSGTCMPEFSDVDKCENLSQEIEIEIQKPDENDEFKIAEKIPVKVRIHNNAEDDIDLNVEVYLYDLTNDEEIDNYDKDVDVESGKKETLEFDIEIPNSVDDKNEHAIFVKVDGDDYCQQNFQKIKIEREKHDVKINSFELPDVADCGEGVEAEIIVENIGKEEEDVGLEISNSELGIYERVGFSLKEFDEDNNKAVKRFVINIPDYAEEKSYNVVAKIDFSGISQSLIRELNVRCEKKKVIEEKGTGTIQLGEKITQEVKAEEKSWFERKVEALNRMNATELTLVIVDIFLGFGIIFIILYLILRR